MENNFIYMKRKEDRFQMGDVKIRQMKFYFYIENVGFKKHMEFLEIIL